MYFANEVTVTAPNAMEALEKAIKVSADENLGMEFGTDRDFRILHMDGSITLSDGSIAPEKDATTLWNEFFTYVGVTVLTEKTNNKWAVSAYYND